jgi:acyl carrier protein
MQKMLKGRVSIIMGLEQELGLELPRNLQRTGAMWRLMCTVN